MSEEEVVDAPNEARAKTSFAAVVRTGRVFSGGKVDSCPGGQLIAAAAHGTLNFVNVETGLCVNRIVLGDEDQISCFAIRPVKGDDDSIHVLIATRSLQLKLYTTADVVHPTRSWKGHSMPVASMAFDGSGTLAACGSSDGRIIVYDVTRHFITHSFNQHAGGITALQFERGAQRLVSSSQDSTLFLWDLVNNRQHIKLTGHLGAVSDFCFLTSDTLVSVGRDRVVMGWDLNGGSARFTVPIYESLECCCALGKDEVCIGGTDGVLKVFRPSTKTVVAKSAELKSQLSNLFFDRAAGTVLCTTADQTIVWHRVVAGPLLERVKVIVGDLDQISDVSVYGRNHERVAVASNSKEIKLWNSSTNDWSVLSGHTDLVLSVDASCPTLLVSGSKDTSVRIWQSDEVDSDFLEASSCALVGHTDAVNGARICEQGSWVASVSKDRTLKIWPLQRNSEGRVESAEGVTPFTAVAHAGEVNCVDISPRAKGGGYYVATGGADKRVCVWFVEAMTAARQAVNVVCKLSGHKRGIWDVRFSSASKQLASASGDGTVRLWRWGTAPQCTRVLQGHSGAVLRVAWITLGTQIVSAGSDGLIKVWSSVDGECQATMDASAAALRPGEGNENVGKSAIPKGKGKGKNGDDDDDDDEIDERFVAKLWALEARMDGALLVCGDSLGQLCVWRDQTLQVQQEELAVQQREVGLKQDMENHIRDGRYAEALSIALSIDHRAKCKTIVDLMRASGGETALQHVVSSQLDEASLTLLVRLCTEWNKNSTHAAAAHDVMNAVLRSFPADSRLLKLVGPSIDSWLAFSDRHNRRLDGLLVRSFVLDHALELMGGDVDVSALEIPARDEPAAAPEALEPREEERRRKSRSSKRMN